MRQYHFEQRAEGFLFSRRISTEEEVASKQNVLLRGESQLGRSWRPFQEFPSDQLNVAFLETTQKGMFALFRLLNKDTGYFGSFMTNTHNFCNDEIRILSSFKMNRLKLITMILMQFG